MELKGLESYGQQATGKQTVEVRTVLLGSAELTLGFWPKAWAFLLWKSICKEEVIKNIHTTRLSLKQVSNHKKLWLGALMIHGTPPFFNSWVPSLFPGLEASQLPALRESTGQPFISSHSMAFFFFFFGMINFFYFWIFFLIVLYLQLLLVICQQIRTWYRTVTSPLRNCHLPRQTWKSQ